MKLKGIHLLENNAEKLALAVCGLFFLAMFVMQFDVFGDPNAVQVQRDKVSPEQATLRVAEMAQEVSAKLQSTRVPNLPEKIDPERAFQLASAGGGSGDLGAVATLTLGPAWGFGGVDSGPDDNVPVAVTDGVLYEPMNVPAPRGALAHVFSGTIDPLVVAQTDELASWVPATQPYDKSAVSIEAVFDAETFREELAQVPDDEHYGSIPSSWLRDVVEILDVKIERQRMNDDGSWGDSEVVMPMPGRFGMRDDLGVDTLQPRDLQRILEDEQANRQDIRRPAYYPMISGEFWHRPSAWERLRLQEESDEAQDRNRLLRRYAALEQDQKRQEELMERIRQEPGEGDNDGGGGESGGPRKPPTADAGGTENWHDHVGDSWPSVPATWLAQAGAGGGPAPKEEDTGNRKAQRLAQVQRKIDRIKQQMIDIRSELMDIYNWDPESGTPVDDPLADALDEPLESIMSGDTEQVTLWGHDITAEPGGTYRYRMSVSLTNPFFPNAERLDEGQRVLADSVQITGEASEWTRAVFVPRQTEFFVTNARPITSGPLGSEADAEIEVFRFYYGYWRAGTVRMKPGDYVAVNLVIPEMPIFELDVEDGVATVVGSENLPPDLELTRDTYLLDVGSRPGNEASVLAYLRDAGGLIIDRDPRSDAVSPMLETMLASALIGETAEVREPGSGLAKPTSAPGGIGAPAGGTGIGGGSSPPRERPPGGGGGGPTKPPI